MVRLMGFEPISFRRQILSLLCMPFHHSRAGNIVGETDHFVKIYRFSRAPINPPAARNRTGCTFLSFGRLISATIAPYRISDT